MSHIEHPLIDHLKATDENVTKFCARVGISRRSLYRILGGGDTTTSMLRRISEATNGAIPVSALISSEEAA